MHSDVLVKDKRISMHLSSGLRQWLFRGLVAAAAAMLVVSFVLPWWTIDLSLPNGNLPPQAIRIYGYGLRHSLVQLSSYLIADETPVYQTALAWAFAAASAALALLSTLLTGNRGRLLLAVTGMGHIAYAVIAIFVVVAGRYAEFGASFKGTEFKLQGWSSFLVEGPANVSLYSTIRPGFYLALAAGGMLILLALLPGVPGLIRNPGDAR